MTKVADSQHSTMQIIVYPLMTISFILSLLSVFAIGHFLVDSYVEVNRVMSTPSFNNPFYGIQMFMAILLISLPTWVTTYFALNHIDKDNSHKFKNSLSNILGIGIFTLTLLTFIHLIYFMYLLLDANINLQSSLHLLVSIVSLILGITFTTLQLKR